MMLDEKKLRVVDANILYLIGALLFWTVGAYAQEKNLMWGLIITQYVIILMPPIIYIKVKKLSIRESLKLNKISFKHCIIVALITILTYPIAVFGNALLMTIMSLMGNLNIPALPTATNSGEYMILMLVISLSAGICEEVFFRGFVLSGYERLGKKKAVVISAILFGIFHFNLYNLAGPIVLGLIFGYLVIETNSIYAGMIGHIVNNGFAVTLGFLVNLATELLPDIETAGEAATEISTTVAMASTTILFGIISAITLFIIFKLVKVIKRDMSVLDSKTHYHNDEVEVKKVEFLPLIIPVCLFIFIAVLQLKEIISLG